jgi:hypothetical protein
VVSFTPRPFYPREEVPFTQCIGGWVGPRAGLDYVEKRKFLTLPGLKLRPLGRPTRSQSLYRLRYLGSLSVLRCPYTCESGSRVRLGSGSKEPNSSVCGAPRVGSARYWLVRVWVVPSQARVSTRQTRDLQATVLWRENAESLRYELQV